MQEDHPQLVATPYASIVKLLTLCRAGPGDVLVDLGSGDGAIPVLAVLIFGVRKGVGIELDPSKFARAKQVVGTLGLLEDRIQLVLGDMYSLELGTFDVVTIFQSQEAIERLLRKLTAELRPGARVVSYLLPLGTMSPLRLVKPARIEHPFYLYEAPLEHLGEEDSVRLLREISAFAEGSEKEWAQVAATIGKR